jgi:thiamine-phosphate pyrophosphorylase
MSKTSHSADAPPRPPTRLLLITPPDAGAAFAATLEAVCRAGDVASVLIWGDERDPKGYLERAKALVPVAQATGAAALVRGDTQLVGRTGADGFHADGTVEDLEAAIDMRPDRIVGAGNLRSRHDAMTAGEMDVDYVFFGNPEPGESRGNAPDLLMERAAWWQEIFQSPCVVFCPTLGLAGPLSAAGADFVALGDAIWTAPDGPVAAIAAVSRDIAMARSHAETTT